MNIFDFLEILINISKKSKMFIFSNFFLKKIDFFLIFPIDFFQNRKSNFSKSLFFMTKLFLSGFFFYVKVWIAWIVLENKKYNVMSKFSFFYFFFVFFY